MSEKDIKEFIKDIYSKIATKEEPYCSCYSGNNSAITQAKTADYTLKDIKNIPEEVIFGLGCGDPTAFAEIK